MAVEVAVAPSSFEACTLAHRLYPIPILQALVQAQVQALVEQVLVQVLAQLLVQVPVEVRLRVRQPHGAGSRLDPTPPYSTYC